MTMHIRPIAEIAQQTAQLEQRPAGLVVQGCTVQGEQQIGRHRQDQPVRETVKHGSCQQRIAVEMATQQRDQIVEIEARCHPVLIDGQRRGRGRFRGFNIRCQTVGQGRRKLFPGCGPGVRHREQHDEEGQQQADDIEKGQQPERSANLGQNMERAVRRWRGRRGCLVAFAFVQAGQRVERHHRVSGPKVTAVAALPRIWNRKLMAWPLPFPFPLPKP